MSGAPAVTVVVLTFNRPRLLARALASLAAETFRDFEVVVVNDAGVDVTGVVDGFRDRLDVRLVAHEVNRGVTVAQNTGIAAARGRYVCFLADDDLHHPHHLATLVPEAERHGGRAVVYSQAEQVVEDEHGGELARRLLPAPDAFDRRLLLVTNFIPGLCPLIPAEAFRVAGLFDEALPVLEDWDLWIRISAAFPFVAVPGITCEYRMRGGIGNITTREVPRFHECLVAVYAKHPVSGDPVLERERQKVVEGSRPRADAFLFDTSVVVASDGDLGRLVPCLEAIGAAMGARSYEVIVHTPRSRETEQLLDAVDGDFTVLFGEGLTADDAWAIGARRASGRRVVRVHDAEVPDGAALGVG